MTIEDTRFKCFLLNLDTGSVCGLVSENENGVCIERLANGGQGELISCGPPDKVAKSYLTKVNWLPSLDYSEAYEFLITFKSKNEPIPVKI